MTRRNLPFAASSAKPSRWLRALRTLLLVASVAALSALSPARAQDQAPADPIATCNLAPPNSCTDLINAGNLSQLDLARALTRRGQMTFLTDTASSIADADRALAILHALGGHRHELIAALNFHATVQYALNHFDQQLADANEVLQLDPSNAEAFMIRGVAYKSKNDGVHAAADFNSVLRINPNNATAYRNLGLVQQDLLQDYPGAIESYTNAVRLDPHEAQSHIYLAQLIYNADSSRFDEAIAHYQQATQINPNVEVPAGSAQTIANAYVDRSSALNVSGDYAGGIDAANHALALDANNANAYNNRGVAYENQGNHAAAISDYNSALRINPQVANAANNLAIAQQQQQQQQAQAEQQQAQDQASTNALTNLFLGGIAAAAGADANTVANVMTGNYAAAAALQPVQQQQPRYQPPTQQYPSASPQQVQANAGNVHNPANDASACLSLRRAPNNSAILFNSCPYAVEAAWCVVGTECGSSGNMWTISANSFYPVLGGNGGELQVRYAACHGANSMDTVRNAPRDGNIHYSCPDSLQRR